MKAPSWWQTRNIVSSLLIPCSWMWWSATYLRMKFIKPERVDAFVICVGNVVAGGGGKTPVSLSIGEYFISQGIPAYFITRGYGAKINKPVLVDRRNHIARDVGDEAMLLATTLPTIACPNRVEAAKLAVSLGAKVIVMDDGFQNPSLNKDLSILILKGNQPLGNGRLIPAGPLRETFSSALKRAHALISLNADDTLKSTLPQFEATTELQLPDLARKNIVAFAGIAQPENFKRDLEQKGCAVSEFFGFADHHFFTDGELKELAASAEKHGALLVTTEKDAVRLPEWFTTRHSPIVAKQQLRWQPGMAIQQLLSRVEQD